MLSKNNKSGPERPKSLGKEKLASRGQPSDLGICEHPDVKGEDIHVVNEDGSLTLGGGNLPGHHDDFDEDVHGSIAPVPGADKKHHPGRA